MNPELVESIAQAVMRALQHEVARGGSWISNVDLEGFDYDGTIYPRSVADEIAAALSLRLTTLGLDVDWKGADDAKIPGLLTPADLIRSAARHKFN